MPSPTPNEAARLDALHGLRIVATSEQAHLDAICRLARDLFSAPVALISCVAEDRLWFQAGSGVSVTDISREHAFCDHTIRSDEVLVIDDATRDPRFCDNPLVRGERGIRFYAAAPLTLRPGLRLGALCILDTVARAFTPEQVVQLRDLAEIVVAHLRLHEAKQAGERELERHLHTQERLRETSELLRATLENMDQGLILYDPDTRVRLHNQRARDLLDLPEAVLYEGSDYGTIHAYQIARGEFRPSPTHLAPALETGDLSTLPDVYERQRPDGTSVEVRVVRLADGSFLRTFTDVTAQRDGERAVAASEARLRVSEERLAHALDSGSDGLWDWDLATGAAWFSDRWYRMLGYESGELEPHQRTWARIVHPDDAKRATGLMRDHLRGLTPLYECEYRLRTKDGGHIWVLTRGRVVIRDEVGRALRVVGTQIDISRRKEAEQQMAHMAAHDALTGLPNRLLFRDRLDHELATAQRRGGSFAVLACDLDRFKAVNDSFGHPAGDALLRAIAERLRTVVRDGDTVARLGGDEFAIILGDLDGPQTASQIAQRVISVVGQPVDLDGHTVNVGVSIGIALGWQDGGDADSLFKNADIALYRAKAAGRNGYNFYEPGMDAAIRDRNRLERDLREAIQGGGFVLHYQPIVHLAGNATGGFEALMRWPHPERGLISPLDFIPLAEETGLIVPLGAWALREACREAAGWPGELRVAVNVSAVQFQQPGLEQAVVGALAASGLAPHRLELEITESVLIQDSASVIACLHRLRGLGVHIALDDFGTGYSSLSYLRSFPFDKIKIDRCFIRDIADPDTAAIVRAIVGIGERLGTAITAEGVETPGQLELVRREGCTEVQGFLYSRPLTAGDARDFVTAHRGQAAA